MSTTVSEDRWTDLARDLHPRGQAFIDGEYTNAQSGETFDCISPIDGSTLVQVAACDTDDVDRAVKGARRVFDSGVWSRMAPEKRKRVLHPLRRADRGSRRRARRCSKRSTWESRSATARNVDIPLAAECIAWFGEAIDKVYDEVAPTIRAPRSA